MTASQIIAAFDGILAWRANYDSSGAWQLTDHNTSSAGLFYNDQHALLSFDNLVAVCPEFDVTEDNQSAANTKFTAWVKEITDSGIIEAVRLWVNRKSELKTANKVLEQSQLFHTSGRLSRLDTNNGHLVGLAFTPRKSLNVKTEIQRVGFMFDTPQDFTLYLFKSDKKVADQSQAISYSTGETAQWEELGWVMDGEGSYFLCYDQDEITGASVNQVQEYSAGQPGISYYPNGKFYQATAFSFTDFNNVLWDVSQNRYSSATNYGLNAELNVRCDYTDFIVNNASAFNDLVLKTVAIRFMEVLSYNAQARTNRNVLNYNHEQIQYALDGDPRGRKSGLRYEQRLALESVFVDHSKIDRLCLPCRKAKTRRTKVI